MGASKDSASHTTLKQVWKYKWSVSNHNVVEFGKTFILVGVLQKRLEEYWTTKLHSVGNGMHEHTVLLDVSTTSAPTSDIQRNVQPLPNCLLVGTPLTFFKMCSAHRSSGHSCSSLSVVLCCCYSFHYGNTDARVDYCEELGLAFDPHETNLLRLARLDHM